MGVGVAGATGAIGKQPGPRLAVGEVGAVLVAERCGAANANANANATARATARRELGWQPAQPSWPQGVAR